MHGSKMQHCCKYNGKLMLQKIMLGFSALNSIQVNYFMLILSVLSAAVYY